MIEIGSIKFDIEPNMQGEPFKIIATTYVPEKL
jgi:hypothetical protein